MNRIVGLCKNCYFARIIENKKGSVFYLCGRSLQDASYPKYPPLPVLNCPGFQDRILNKDK